MGKFSYLSYDRQYSAHLPPKLYATPPYLTECTSSVVWRTCRSNICINNHICLLWIYSFILKCEMELGGEWIKQHLKKFTRHSYGDGKGRQRPGGFHILSCIWFSIVSVLVCDRYAIVLPFELHLSLYLCGTYVTVINVLLFCYSVIKLFSAIVIICHLDVRMNTWRLSVLSFSVGKPGNIKIKAHRLVTYYDEPFQNDLLS